MTQFFSQLLQQVHDSRDPTGPIPHPADHNIRYDYAGRDQMILGVLLQPNSIELSNLVENFAVIVWSGQHVIVNNNTVFLIRLFTPFVDSGQNRPKSPVQDHLIKIMKSIKHCPLDAPWCVYGSILLAYRSST